VADKVIEWRKWHMIKELIDTLVKTLLWGWYLFGFITASAVWFYPLPATNIQTFVALGLLVFYSLVSAAITKLKEIKGQMSD